VLEESTNWSSDDWNGGWENLREEPYVKIGIDEPASLHPLHTCWMEIMKKLVGSVVWSQFILLLESEVESLFQLLLDVEC
jgi:hypothetical protein